MTRLLFLKSRLIYYLAVLYASIVGVYRGLLSFVLMAISPIRLESEEKRTSYHVICKASQKIKRMPSLYLHIHMWLLRSTVQRLACTWHSGKFCRIAVVTSLYCAVIVSVSSRLCGIRIIFSGRLSFPDQCKIYCDFHDTSSFSKKP